MLDASSAASKWARNLGASTQDIQAGVQAVTVSPTAKAAAASAKWQQNVASAATKTKFENALKGVSLSAWQDAMITKGIPRVSAGATAAQPKYQAFAADFYPFLATLQAKIKAMPNMTLQDSINRMVAQVQGASTYVKKS